jgi:hypothetical protein
MTRGQERDTVRELARQVAEIAAAPENEAIRRRWRGVNALGTPDRAPVWCRPVGAWNEILPDDHLTCTDTVLRAAERRLRRVLIKHDIGDDSPIDDFFAVPARFHVAPPNRWGLDVAKRQPADAGGAWAYDPPLKTEADFEKLRLPTFTFDEPGTEKALACAHDLLGDVLPVRRTCGAPLTATLGYPAADLRGLTQMMLDAAARPDLLHRLMAHLRDGTLKAMDEIEATGLLTSNHTGPMTCSEPIGDRGDGPLTYANLWCIANSQEFDGMSPAMWEAFCLDYQRPILARFGRSAYGCCENLTDKIDGVLSIPNLRIFVCSAWTDLDKVIERCGTERVIMWRQKASDVVFAEDTDAVRRDLEAGLKRLRGCRYQIVLRELQTLAGHPDRLHVWTRAAKELAAKYA